MLTQAKLDQAVLELRGLRWRPPRRTVFDLTGGGFAGLFGALSFLVDSREAHGLGDLVLSALLRGVRGEIEPPPRVVTDVTWVDGVLRVETRQTRLWVAFGKAPDGVTPEAAPGKRWNAAVLLDGEGAAPEPYGALSHGAFLEALRRFMPAYLAGAEAHWWAVLADWMTALERATGGSTMKDLTEALRFYDRNKEKIESLLAFRRELAEESESFAKRLEGKLRAAGLGDGLSCEPGGRLCVSRTLRLQGTPYEVAWVAEVRLEDLTIRAAPVVRRDLKSRRRPSAEEAERLLAESGLAALVGERRINPENPEAMAYQTLKAMTQAAEDAFAKLV